MNAFADYEKIALHPKTAENRLGEGTELSPAAIFQAELDALPFHRAFTKVLKEMFLLATALFSVFLIALVGIVLSSKLGYEAGMSESLLLAALSIVVFGITITAMSLVVGYSAYLFSEFLVPAVSNLLKSWKRNK